MEIFNQTTFTESDFEEILLILEDEGTNIWESIPVSFVENLFKQEHQFLASKIFCTLVSTPGSSAFGVTSDIQVIRTFLSCLRKFATPGENNTTNSKKKRKSNPSDEWELFFRTVMILNEQLELSEIANVLISIGCFVNSYDAIRFISDESFTEKKKIYFLKFLLTEISKIVKENELTKEKSSWLSSCLLGLTENNSDHLFAFLQRLILSCEISTQTNRQKVIDFISTNISNADEEFVQRIIKFSLNTLMNNEKSSKRTFGCELIANLTMQPYPELIQSLSIRTRDTIPSVRCAALRGITILCNKNSFLLLDEDESLLKAAIEIVSKDDKPVVRRWGLKVLSFLPSYNEQAVLVCTERCRDVSISVKKAALETLGCFVSRYPSSAGWAWRYGILPSLRDEEKSVSDSALLTVRKILFAKNNDDHIWTLLYSIRSESDLDCLSMAFKHEKKDEIVFKDFVSSIVERAAMSLPSPDSVSRREILWGAWLILDECRDHLPGPKILSGNFILDAWDSVKGLLSLDEDESNFVGVFEVHALQRRVLRVLGKIISRIPLEKQIELGNELLNDLSNLERPPEVVSEMLLTLYSLCEGKRETVIEWGLYLKQLCEDVLANGEKESILRIDCALFLLGELCMLGFNPDNNEDKLIRFETEETVTTLIQAMIMNISSSTR